MIYYIDNENKHLFTELLVQMYKQRATVFIDRMKWDLEARDGLEIDQFDTDSTIYLILIDDKNGEIRSSVRLNPTIEPHLMSEIFSSFCEKGVPRGNTIWEISRYCNNPDIHDRQMTITAFKELMCGVMECSLLHSWETLTFLIGMPLLSHSISCGWDVSPLGMPQKDMKISVCAFSVNVTPTGLSTMRKNINLTGPALKIIPGNRVAA